VLGATWDEIKPDTLDGDVWEIPGPRMKGGKPHRVPLVPRAVEIVMKMHALRVNDYVFPGARTGRPISQEALVNLMDDVEVTDATRHGFRSSFKDFATDWVPPLAEVARAAKRGERLESFPRDLVEVALAHKLPSRLEEAYRHSKQVKQRRRLMERWAAHCGKGQNVVPMRRAQ
jgi:integrase